VVERHVGEQHHLLVVVRLVRPQLVADDVARAAADPLRELERPARGARQTITGADSLARLSDLNPWLNLLMAIGLGASLPPMTTARNGRDVAFTQPIDERIGRAIVGAIISATRRA
jgi:hypothetical protein